MEEEMRVALVGPTGVLGRALVPLLMAKGFTVRLLARSAEKARRLFPEVAEVVEIDLLAATVGELAQRPGRLGSQHAPAH